jgi:hypothetical protein
MGRCVEAQGGVGVALPCTGGACGTRGTAKDRDELMVKSDETKPIGDRRFGTVGRGGVQSGKGQSRLIKVDRGGVRVANVAPRRRRCMGGPGLESPGYRQGIAPRWVLPRVRYGEGSGVTGGIEGARSRVIKVNQSKSKRSEVGRGIGPAKRTAFAPFRKRRGSGALQNASASMGEQGMRGRVCGERGAVKSRVIKVNPSKSKRKRRSTAALQNASAPMGEQGIRWARGLLL